MSQVLSWNKLGLLDEMVKRVVEAPPSLGERVGELGCSWVQVGQARPEDAGVALGEEEGQAAAVWGKGVGVLLVCELELEDRRP